MNQVASTENDRYKWQLLGIVLVGTMMAALDSSIVNVSIPSIMHDLQVNLEEVEWVISSYMLGFAVSMPLTAWLRDQIGHKKLYIASLAIFTLSSVLCGLAWNLPVLIVARVLQAFGGGALTPTGMAMVSEVFEPHERSRAMGIWAMGAVMGPTFGPTLGGLLTQEWGWPAIFLVNLPIGLITMALAWRILRKDNEASHQKRAFDVKGFLLLAIFLISFLLGMTKGNAEGWTSPFIKTCVLIAGISFALFIWVEKNNKSPILNFQLLKAPVFRACFILAGLRSLALYGGTFLLPVFMQNQMHKDELSTGLLLFPGSLIMALTMPLGGKIGDKVGARWMALIGFLMLSCFFFLYRDITPDVSSAYIVIPTIIRGIGIGLLVPPVMVAALNAIPNNQGGMASSMLNIIQQVGGAIGIALLSLIVHLETQYTEGHDVISASVVTGFQDAFIVGALVNLIALYFVFKLPADAPKKT